MRPALGRSRLRIGDVVRLLVSWLLSTLALGVAVRLLDGLTANSFWDVLWASAITAVVGLLIRPAIVLVSAYVGWIAVVLAGLLGQALVTYVALEISPGITTTVGAAIVASWIVAATGTAVAWLTTSGTDDAFALSLERGRKRVTKVDDPDVDGIVFIQLDGLPFPVLRWAIAAGSVPTMRRWVSSGDHVLREWTPQLPCTTPASQLGILHGTIDRVPAFRWYDRELGRLLVANRPADAAIIEERASDGRGLLADGGVSVSNIFTGDAERSFLTMSRAKLGRSDVGKRRTFAGFLDRPPGLHAGLRAHHRRDRQGALPGASSGTTRPHAAGPPRLDLRGAPGGDQRAGPRPQHRDHHRGDAQGHPQHLRRLRRLRRDRPPRRASSGPSRWPRSRASTGSSAPSNGSPSRGPGATTS